MDQDKVNKKNKQYIFQKIMQKELDSTLITFDTDWAPDWCVRECYEMCKAAGAGATFFVTDYLPVLNEIANDPMFEIGIHPNFLVGSSHGNDERTVLKYCLSLFEQIGINNSNGISMRTHSLYQSSRLFVLIATEFPQIRRDVSIFMPYVSGLKPFRFKMFSNLHTMLRIPFYWEDDYAATSESFVFSGGEGLKVFNFHPIHVALNTENMSRYEDLKKACDIRKVKPSDIEKHKNKNFRGTKDFLKSIIDNNNSSNFINTISSISSEE